jgi:hypothetical protein
MVNLGLRPSWGAVLFLSNRRLRGGTDMTITPETQREVLKQLRTAMADLEAIEEECGGAHDD